LKFKIKMYSNDDFGFFSTCIRTGGIVFVGFGIPNTYGAYYNQDTVKHSNYIKCISTNILAKKNIGEFISFEEQKSTSGSLRFVPPTHISSAEVMLQVLSSDKEGKTLLTGEMFHKFGFGKNNDKKKNVNFPPNQMAELELSQLSADALLMTKKDGNFTIQLHLLLFNQDDLVMEIPLVFIDSTATPIFYGSLTSYTKIKSNEKSVFGEKTKVQVRAKKRPEFLICKGENSIMLFTFNAFTQFVNNPQLVFQDPNQENNQIPQIAENVIQENNPQLVNQIPIPEKDQIPQIAENVIPENNPQLVNQIPIPEKDQIPQIAENIVQENNPLVPAVPEIDHQTKKQKIEHVEQSEFLTDYLSDVVPVNQIPIPENNQIPQIAENIVQENTPLVPPVPEIDHQTKKQKLEHVEQNLFKFVEDIENPTYDNKNAIAYLSHINISLEDKSAFIGFQQKVKIEDVRDPMQIQFQQSEFQTQLF